MLEKKQGFSPNIRLKPFQFWNPSKDGGNSNIRNSKVEKAQLIAKFDKILLTKPFETLLESQTSFLVHQA
ncbi:hypothetical protein BH18ACI3_BH18ACI3_20910 [soil metagenome]